MKPEINEHLKSLAPKVVEILKNVEAMTSLNLANLLKISERELRLIVEFCRRHITGRIISGNFGYKYSLESSEKIQKSYNRIKQQSYSQLYTVKCAERLLAEEQI